MTCIDSAIIKALVEHIGMNPDDVPIGGGSGSGSGSSEQSSSTFLDATWSTDNGGIYYQFTLPEGQEIDVGSIIRLDFKNETDKILDYLVIEETTPDGSDYKWYTIINFPIDFNDTRISEQGLEFNGEYYTLVQHEVVLYKKPDNKNTGIISNRSYAGLLELLVSIINGILAMPKAA